MSEEINFQKELDRLNKILDEIEKNNNSLDESLKLYQEGCELIKKLQGTLKVAEEKVEKIINKVK